MGCGVHCLEFKYETSHGTCHNCLPPLLQNAKLATPVARSPHPADNWDHSSRGYQPLVRSWSSFNSHPKIISFVPYISVILFQAEFLSVGRDHCLQWKGLQLQDFDPLFGSWMVPPHEDVERVLCLRGLRLMDSRFLIEGIRLWG